MKYFTRKFGLGTHEQDMAAIAAYWAQFETLRPRLSARAVAFFKKAHIHDGDLLRCGYTKTSPPRRLGQPAVFELEVHEGWDPKTNMSLYGKWIVRYVGVRRVHTEFKTWNSKPVEFGDWIYHELTDAGKGFLRHEIIFGSGATLRIEFQKIQAKRIAGPKKK